MQTFWSNYLENKLTTLNINHGSTHNIALCSQEQSYALVTEQTILMPLPSLAFIQVKGQDAQKFLQGQFTCQFKEDEIIQMRLGAHCSEKGKIQNFFRIFNCYWEDEPCYLLILQLNTLSETLTRLRKYALFSKVIISDKTKDLAAFTLYGDQASTWLENTYHSQALKINDYITLDEKHSLLARLRGDKPRYLFIANLEAITALWEKCNTQFTAINSEFWNLLEIRAGIPIIFSETVDLFFPHYLNLPTLNAVSFEKGCYLGQEVIARMQYRGKVNKHLHRALISDSTFSPQPNDEILYCENEQSHAVGHVIVASPTTVGSYELLILLKDDHQNFENLFLKLVDGPKLHHLNLTYT